jgi:hypothetical protein
MNNKKSLFFGLIEMNKVMYNILYTLLCVCVLLIILILSAYGLAELEDRGVINETTWTQALLVNGLLIFISYKLMDKKHYA